MENYSAQQQAVALAYETGDFAPSVLAKGHGAIAEHIIAIAKEQGVFVHESKELVAMLMQLDLDEHIPVEHYQAIAEMLAWLYRLESGDSL
ncbi:MAG: EscU/YscU/HrcU family type III secretion system export apparatus switch protein [Methylophilaceae bacterium]